LHFSISFHPQTDGKIEVVKGVWKHISDVLVHTNLKTGLDGCRGLSFDITPIGTAPLEPLPTRLCMADRPSIASYIPRIAKLQAVEDALIERDIALQLLKGKLVKPQEMMKKLAT